MRTSRTAYPRANRTNPEKGNELTGNPRTEQDRKRVIPGHSGGRRAVRRDTAASRKRVAALRRCSSMRRPRSATSLSSSSISSSAAAASSSPAEVEEVVAVSEESGVLRFRRLGVAPAWLGVSESEPPAMESLEHVRAEASREERSNGGAAT